MTPEGRCKAAIKKMLDAAGVYYLFPVTGGYGRSGLPDIVCCVRGRFLAIEAKAGKGKTTALQDRELQRIKDAGGVSMVVYEDDESQQQLANVLKALA